MYYVRLKIFEDFISLEVHNILLRSMSGLSIRKSVMGNRIISSEKEGVPDGTPFLKSSKGDFTSHTRLGNKRGFFLTSSASGIGKIVICQREYLLQ